MPEYTKQEATSVANEMRCHVPPRSKKDEVGT